MFDNKDDARIDTPCLKDKESGDGSTDTSISSEFVNCATNKQTTKQTGNRVAEEKRTVGSSAYQASTRNRYIVVKLSAVEGKRSCGVLRPRGWKMFADPVMSDGPPTWDHLNAMTGCGRPAQFGGRAMEKSEIRGEVER